MRENIGKVLEHARRRIREDPAAVVPVTQKGMEGLVIQLPQLGSLFCAEVVVYLDNVRIPCTFAESSGLSELMLDAWLSVRLAAAEAHRISQTTVAANELRRELTEEDHEVC
jgi:methyl coenzyme M reductase subunit C-like uncharacterized protein (methanogenesis marker protein 7)